MFRWAGAFLCPSGFAPRRSSNFPRRAPIGDASGGQLGSGGLSRTILATTVPKPLTVLERRWPPTLVDAGLLAGKHQESDGGRVRQVLTVTAKGKKVLDGNLQAFLSEPATVSVEDALRVVDMAKHYGAQPSNIAGYLRAAAAQRSTGAKMSRDSTAGIDDDLSIIGTRTT